MNTGIVSLVVGLVAFVLAVADAVMTGRLADRIDGLKPAELRSPGDSSTGPQEDPDLQALRLRINQLNTELLSLHAAPIRSMEELEKVVTDHLAVRRRREAVEAFVTRKKEIRLQAKDWGKVVSTAYRLSKEDSARADEVMKQLTDDWLSLAALTGGEPELETQLEALLSRADKELLALIPEAEQKRYRPIPRGWSSGLLGDASEK